jgi:signal peptidase I
LKSLIREVLITLVIAVIIFLLLHFSIQNFIVEGHSMQPDLQDGERIFASKVTYYFSEPERGDVIILRLVSEQGTPLIKRLIALPGDTVAVKDGAVYINGTKLNEPYIKEPPAYELSERTVPEGEYFFLGDNRNNSSDSHTGWTIPRKNIIAKAWLAYWPPSQWGIIDHYPLDEQLEEPAEEQPETVSLFDDIPALGAAAW